MARKIISIDNGIYNLKAKCGKESFCYRNGFEDGTDTNSDFLGDNTFRVSYRGKEQTIGEHGTRHFTGEGKSSDQHIINALTAVTRFITKKGKSEIYIMYGESINKYFNQDHKNTIISKLEGEHSIIINGEIYNFLIKKVHILPEGLGHILSDIENYNKMQYVVDIGGGTINFLTVLNGRPLKDECTSFKQGVHNIIAKISKAADITIPLATQYIQNKSESPTYVQEIIDKILKEHFTKFDISLEDLGIDIHKILSDYEVTFIGGGADLLKDYILKHYKGATIYEDSVMANVKGFYEFGVAVYSEE